MLGKTIQPEITELIEKRELSTLREVLLDFHPGELAELIDDIDEKDRAIVFRVLPQNLAADVLNIWISISKMP